MGRRKTPTEFIADKCQRLVSFSKRRSGLFKKAANGLCARGCHVAIIVFSGAGNAFSFANPDLHTVVARFRSAIDVDGGHTEEEREPAPVGAADEAVGLEETVSDDLSDAMAEEEEDASEEADSREVTTEEPWWNKPADDLGLEELRVLDRSMVKLRDMAKKRMADLLGDEPLSLCSWKS